MTIKQRILLLLGISIAALLAIGLLGLFQSRQIAHHVEHLTESTVPAALAAADLNTQLQKVELLLVSHVYAPDETIAEQQKLLLLAALETLQQQLKTELQHAGSEREQGILQHAHEALGVYASAVKEITALPAAQRTIADAMLFGNVVPALSEVDKVLENLRIEQGRSKDQAFAGLGHMFSRMSVLLFAGMFLLSAVLLGIGWRLYRNVSAPLQAMSLAMGEIATTLDFTRRVPVRQRDEVGTTVESFNKLLAILQASLSEMRRIIADNERAAVDMHSTASQLAEIATSGSSSSELIHSSVRQISDHIEEISATTTSAAVATKQSGEMATSNAQLINTAVTQMTTLGEKVHATAGNVYALAEAGAAVAGMVVEIRDIAGQTNLLALNAAIEAARAGESGRGFAVVADEVRKLAARTASSTELIETRLNEINTLSAQSCELMQSVEDEVRVTVGSSNGVGSGIREIEQSAHSMLSMVDTIHAMVEEGQASSQAIVAQVHEISNQMSQADEVARNTRQSASQIREISSTMAAIVSRFKVGEAQVA